MSSPQGAGMYPDIDSMDDIIESPSQQPANAAPSFTGGQVPQMYSNLIEGNENPAYSAPYAPQGTMGNQNAPMQANASQFPPNLYGNDDLAPQTVSDDSSDDQYIEEQLNNYGNDFGSKMPKIPGVNQENNNTMPPPQLNEPNTSDYSQMNNQFSPPESNPYANGIEGSITGRKSRFSLNVPGIEDDNCKIQHFSGEVYFDPQTKSFTFKNMTGEIRTSTQIFKFNFISGSGSAELVGERPPKSKHSHHSNNATSEVPTQPEQQNQFPEQLYQQTASESSNNSFHQQYQPNMYGNNNIQQIPPSDNQIPQQQYQNAYELPNTQQASPPSSGQPTNMQNGMMGTMYGMPMQNMPNMNNPNEVPNNYQYQYQQNAMPGMQMNMQPGMQMGVQPGMQMQQGMQMQPGMNPMQPGINPMMNMQMPGMAPGMVPPGMQNPMMGTMNQPTGMMRPQGMQPGMMQPGMYQNYPGNRPY